jgi:hypothetical protein
LDGVGMAQEVQKIFFEGFSIFQIFYTPFRIEDALSNRSNPFISAPEGGILNENWCKNREHLFFFLGIIKKKNILWGPGWPKNFF